MNESIRPLTTEDVRASARTAAELQIHCDEANPYEAGSELWRVFRLAYIESRNPVEEVA